MPLRRTKRSDGRPRPRWKDGSHEHVESTHANESRTDEIALESNQQIELLVTAPLLFQRSHENPVSTRDRIAKAGADARIKESMANGEVRLALRPYGSSDCRHFLPDEDCSAGSTQGGEGRSAGCGGRLQSFERSFEAAKNPPSDSDLKEHHPSLPELRSLPPSSRRPRRLRCARRTPCPCASTTF